MSGRLRRFWRRVRGLPAAVARGAWRGAVARFRDLLMVRRLLSWSTPADLAGLPALFAALRHGGLEVTTAGPAGRPAASTLVLPDGDLVSRVSRDALREPELLRRHRQTVLRGLEPLTRASAAVRALSGLLAAGGAALAAYCLGSAGAAAAGGLEALSARLVALWGEIRWPVAAGALAGAARFALGQWLRAQFEKLLG